MVRVRPITLLVICLVVSSAASAANGPQGLYAAARAREQALRTAMDADAPAVTLTDVRAVVTAYRAVTRRYPGSAYSDDALWLAARLSFDAFDRFGDVRDKNTAVGLLRFLV